MSCENYKKALIDAAASGDALSLALRAHMAACSSCIAAFERERSLLAAIDGGVRAAANAPIPASFLPAVHVRISQEDASAAKRQASAHWAYYAAAAVAVIIAVWPPPRWDRDALRSAQTEAGASVASTGRKQDLSVQPGLTAERSVAPVDPRADRGRNSPTMTRTSASSARMKSDRMRVLVPPDQELLMARYLHALHEGSLRLAAGDSSKPPTLGSPIDVIEVSRVELLPLPDLGPDSTSEGKQLGDTVNGVLK
jgi:hypothetical protein